MFFDTIDFWRVEAYEDNHLLRLRAEMKVPGKAWLEFQVKTTSRGSQITQTARFDPAGLFGKLYWYALIPIHQLVFTGMLRGIAKAAGEQNGTIRKKKKPCSPPSTELSSQASS